MTPILVPCANLYTSRVGCLSYPSGLLVDHILVASSYPKEPIPLLLEQFFGSVLRRFLYERFLVFVFRYIFQVGVMFINDTFPDLVRFGTSTDGSDKHTHQLFRLLCFLTVVAPNIESTIPARQYFQFFMVFPDQNGCHFWVCRYPKCCQAVCKNSVNI